MSMAFLNLFLKRGTTSDELAGEITDAGEMLTAAAMSPYEEITRSGVSFHVQNTTPTASVVALPTTTAGIGFFNTADDGGVSAIIDYIWATNIVGHSTLGQAHLIYVIGQTSVAALSADFVVRKSNGKGPGSDNKLVAKAGGAILDSVTGVAIGWVPCGQTSNHSVVSLPGAVLSADIGGRIIVPPGRQFGVNVMASNTQFTWNIGVMWHEKVLSLG